MRCCPTCQLSQENLADVNNGDSIRTDEKTY